jgi:hypothetical protein
MPFAVWDRLCVANQASRVNPERYLKRWITPSFYSGQNVPKMVNERDEFGTLQI